MKKRFHVIMFVLLFFLVACDETKTEEEFSFEGTYAYEEAVYLNPLSSATLDYETAAVKDVRTLEITEDSLIYTNDDVTKVYDQLRFVEKEIYEDLDDLFSIDINNVFDTFDKRYDLYDGDTPINLTLFLKEDELYIADARYLGNGNPLFTIWVVYRLSDSLEE